MKKNLIFGMAIAAALVMTGCKSSESSYKKAYEKAQQVEQVEQKVEEAVQTVPAEPVVKPVETVDPYANESVRTERLQSVTGVALKAYNVVCGSFKSLSYANNLRQTLVNKGYGALVAQNPETGMYRVVAETMDDKGSAVQLRNRLRSTYPDAWLLYNNAF